MAHDDPVEYVGSNTAERAEPVRKRGVAAAAAQPVPSVAVYTPPSAGEAHPKTARLGPARRLDQAAADLTACNLELTSARGALRNAELVEADALLALVKAMPGPTPDELLRQHAASQLKMRADRVAAGLSPENRPAPKIGNSEVDRLAAQRPRNSAQMANMPLRSPVVRRTV